MLLAAPCKAVSAQSDPKIAPSSRDDGAGRGLPLLRLALYDTKRVLSLAGCTPRRRSWRQVSLRRRKKAESSSPRVGVVRYPSTLSHPGPSPGRREEQAERVGLTLTSSRLTDYLSDYKPHFLSQGFAGSLRPYTMYCANYVSREVLIR